MTLAPRIQAALTVAALMPLAVFAQDPVTTTAAAPVRAARATTTLPLVQFPPAPAVSSPGVVTALYTNIATSATSDVPGVAGAKFMASTTSTAIFDRPWLSPNGTHWAVTADTDMATTEDEVLIEDGVVVVREGTTFPPDATQTWGTLDTRIGINDAGEIALTMNVAPATANDDYTVKISAGPTYTVFSQQGGAIGALPGTFWNNNADSPVLLNDGRISVSDDIITGAVTTADDEIIVLDSTLIAREGITIPGNQDAGATNAWDNFSLEDTWVSTGGTHTLILGDLLGAATSDQVLVYDGNVVLQEGVVIAGSSYTSPIGSTGILYAMLDSSGGWIARGHNADGEDWVVKNGVVVLTSTGSAVALQGGQVLMTASLDGAQETPSTGSTATGTGVFLVDTSLNTITYNITLTGLTGVESAAHIHGFAPAGTPAGILYPLPLGNSKVGVLSYLESEEAGILAGQTYVNVHSDLFPSGEIRGQIVSGTEHWFSATTGADTFFAVANNQLGDYVVMGTTDGPSQANGVIALNSTHVIARENDPIDLDGNGLYDDDTYFNTFGNDDVVLADDGTVYFTATIRNGAGAQVGHGFFRRRGGNLQRAYCFGDGSGTACPCGNASPAGSLAGCVNSMGESGRLDSSGIASVASDSLVFSGSHLVGPALFFQGTTTIAGGAAFGDGLRCVGGTQVRLAIKHPVGGSSSYPEMGDPSVSVGGGVSAGAVRAYQCIYRDAASFCTSDTFNFTNGVLITWAP